MEIYNVGTGILRDKRIEKIDNLYKSFGIEFNKVEQKDKIHIAYFEKNVYSYEEYTNKIIEIEAKLIEDSLTIDILEEIHYVNKQLYYKTLVEKASKNEVDYNYSTCYYLVEGNYNGVFAGENIEYLQSLLNKGLIKCEVLDKKYTPKEHIVKLAKKDFYIEDNSGLFKRYVSDKHRVVVSTTRLSASYIIKTLISGYTLISYIKGRNFVVKYTFEEGLHTYIKNNKNSKFYCEVRG